MVGRKSGAGETIYTTFTFSSFVILTFLFGDIHGNKLALLDQEKNVNSLFLSIIISFSKTELILSDVGQQYLYMLFSCTSTKEIASSTF